MLVAEKVADEDNIDPNEGERERELGTSEGILLGANVLKLSIADWPESLALCEKDKFCCMLPAYRALCEKKTVGVTEGDMKGSDEGRCDGAFRRVDVLADKDVDIKKADEYDVEMGKGSDDGCCEGVFRRVLRDKLDPAE